MTPFKLGMRVAKTIDPNTYYDLEPANGRPFIMSPYLACMNTFSAWASPSNMSRAVVCLQHTTSPLDPSPTRPRSQSVQDIVPVESDGQSRKYWHFIGLQGDARIDALLERNKAILLERPSSGTPKRPMPKQQLSFGTRSERDELHDTEQRKTHATMMKKADRGE